MTPYVALLDSKVELQFEEGGDEAAVRAAGKNKGTFQSLRDSTISFLGSLKPDPLLHDPPKVSTFVLRSSGHRLDAATYSAAVACADKSMLVLYGGSYDGPGSFACGCYLIYDAAAPTLMSTVPPLPLSPPRVSGIGAGAVALRSHPPSSSFVLAELAVAASTQLPDTDGELFLWRSESPTPQWERKAVQLPPEVDSTPGKHSFSVDASFSFGTSSLCWIDLLRGMVVCNLDQQQEFRFIPLPADECSQFGTDDYPYRPRMSEFRTAACVAGTIKLVSLEGYLENWECHPFKFVIWSLTPDLAQWNKDAEFQLSDIWASEEYLALNIPQRTPICPVLSPLDGVVFVIVNDVEVHNIVQGTEVVDTRVNVKGQYILSLDMQSKKIISIAGPDHASKMVPLMPRLLATDFCAYLQGPKDRQRNVKASKVGEGAKRPKVC